MAPRDDDDPDAPPLRATRRPLDVREPDDLERAGEPPVVARFVIEIRSDGTRTIARGAAEDRLQGEQVAIEVRGTSPLQLALSLARAILQLPSLARTAMSPLLPGKRRH